MELPKKKGLGRGLGALIPPSPVSQDAPPAADTTIPTGSIRASPWQPRSAFDEAAIQELAESIREQGIVQPLLVRRRGDAYELIAGERRLRAAERLGWAEIAAVVKAVDDQTLLTLALVENLQRANLNALEEAEGYQRLVDEFGLTQQQVADVIGKDRTTVTSTLRLLHLPASVRRMVQARELSAGHARALLALTDERAMAELAREAVARGWSVREVERRVRELVERPARVVEPAKDARPAEVRRTEDHLRRHFATDVDIRLKGEAKGEIRIAFYSTDDFDRLLELFGTRPE